MSVLYAAATTNTPFSGPGYGFTAGEGKKVVPPRSLVISPNLDALLEHEERQRTTSLASMLSPIEPMSPLDLLPVSPVLSQSMAPSAEFPIGLPPPPRRARGPKTLRSPSGTLQEAQSMWDIENQENVRPSTGSSSQSNPYINPAPTLEDMWSRDPAALLASQQSPVCGNLHEFKSSRNAPDDRPASFLVRTSENTKASRPRAPEMRQTPAPAADPSHERGPWPRRPLISHGKQSSVSSSESIHSISTRPASSAENEVRISISSTIYPPSAESHTHTLFNEPPLDTLAHRDSFMDFYSPTNAQFDLESSSFAPQDSQESPIQFAQPSSPVEPTQPDSGVEITRAPSPKPAIPTTPKPIFTRPGLRSKLNTPKGSPPDDQVKPKPATTNFLDTEERADLVRKSRKLARVFGQTPDADAMAHQDSGRSASNSFLSTRRARGTAFDPARPQTVWRDGTGGPPILAPVRRHSLPLSPDDVSFISIISPIDEPLSLSPTRSRSRQGGNRSISKRQHHGASQKRSDSPMSFIDLSEDAIDPPDSASIKSNFPSSPSQSTFDTTSIDQQEEDRRRKRERLAKLHRFLGSRVPANLVLGFDDMEASLPPPQHSPTSPPKASSSSSEGDESPRKAWLKRRTASVAVPPSSWSDSLERVKEELDDREKAINVRRAQKMEKVFGVAPPQTLYHTRHSALPLAKSTATPVNPTPMMETTSLPVQLSFKAPKQKKKKGNRPGTAESSKGLLPKASSGYGFGAFDERLAMNAGNASEPKHSFVYNHYQHSLNSLNDIIDRDDRESLTELYQYLNGGNAVLEDEPHNTGEATSTSTTPTWAMTPTQPQSPMPPRDRRLSTASSIKSERRRSLPARTSMISLNSDYSASISSSLSSPSAEVTSFQVRRRRAAKLTQFFGVDYRDLINDVLESIEIGVQHESSSGTLRAEEVEDLLARLRNIKTKRQSFI